jgi:hypothetical protein
MSSGHRTPSEVPTRVDQIRSGDPYELSNGRAIYCAPTGHEGTGPNGLGFAVLDSDPAVKRAGVDTGVELGPRTLRAPDVAVNFEAGDGTWATTIPLAVEYAGKGQDEGELRTKIHELLQAGTQQVWVVRLVGPRRVEVHRKGAATRIANVDEALTAPGVLALPVPVRALFERGAAHETTLRNLLAAKGYAGLDAVREEGHKEGSEAALQSALHANVQARGLTLDAAQEARVAACHDPATLLGWITRAATATEAAAIFEGADET